MTPEQKVAFINAQIALFNAEVTSLNAMIQIRLARKEDASYHKIQLDQTIARYEGVLGWNAVISYFQE